MFEAAYWGRLLSGKRTLGGCFLLSTQYAITAAHCLDGVKDEDSTLAIVLGEARKVPARLRDRNRSRDLAVLELDPDDTADILLAAPAPCLVSDPWIGQFRERFSEPKIAGSVTCARMPLLNASGELVEVAQLESSVDLADYSGYSGGPVERNDGKSVTVLHGVVVEQTFERGATKRAANLVFAATIAEIYRTFQWLRVADVLGIDEPGHDSHARSDDIASQRDASQLTAESLDESPATIDIVLEYIKDTSTIDVLTHPGVSTLRIQVLRSIISLPPTEAKE